MNIRLLYLLCLTLSLVTGCIQSDPDDPASAAGSQTQAPDAPEAGTADAAEGLCGDFYYQLCDDDDDCTQDGYICGPIVEGCLSSTCGCDADTGSEVCSADCLMGGRLCVSDAQVDGPQATGGSDAGVSGGSDAGVSGGSDAGVSGGSDAGTPDGGDAGRSGGSDVDTVGGADDATAGTGGTSMDGAEDLCADFYYQPCIQDSDCERDGYVCNDNIGDCISSACDCDPETGEAGICTADCGTGGLCEPRTDNSESGGSDVGSTGGSESGSDAGTAGSSDGDSAGGSNDGVAGGSGSTDLCADFYYQTCSGDSDCQRAGYVCGPVVNGCVPSTCGCDPNTGESGFCTADCGMGLGLCEPAP